MAGGRRGVGVEVGVGVREALERNLTGSGRRRACIHKQTSAVGRWPCCHTNHGGGGGEGGRAGEGQPLLGRKGERQSGRSMIQNLHTFAHSALFREHDCVAVKVQAAAAGGGPAIIHKCVRVVPGRRGAPVGRSVDEATPVPVVEADCDLRKLEVIVLKGRFRKRGGEDGQGVTAANGADFAQTSTPGKQTIEAFR